MRAPPRPARSPRDLVGLALKGLGMGAADVVPGVSGGTMALVFGVYRELIGALRSLTGPAFLRPLARGRLREAFRAVDWPLLLALGAGVLTAVGLLAHAMTWLLENARVLVFALFFGLILGSVATVARRVARWRGVEAGAFALGAAGAFLLVGLTPAETPSTAPVLIASGALAISALLLPGVSGAFILVLLGKYDVVLGALTRLDLGVILPFALGALVGLLGFSQLLGWLFARHPDPTLALLAGFLLGSLRRVWPWQHEVGTGLVNVAPGSGGGALAALALAALGVALVLLLERGGAGRGVEPPS